MKMLKVKKRRVARKATTATNKSRNHSKDTSAPAADVQPLTDGNNENENAEQHRANDFRDDSLYGNLIDTTESNINIYLRDTAMRYKNNNINNNNEMNKMQTATVTTTTDTETATATNKPPPALSRTSTLMDKQRNHHKQQQQEQPQHQPQPQTQPQNHLHPNMLTLKYDSNNNNNHSDNDMVDITMNAAGDAADGGSGGVVATTTTTTTIPTPNSDSTELFETIQSLTATTATSLLSLSSSLSSSCSFQPLSTLLVASALSSPAPQQIPIQKSDGFYSTSPAKTRTTTTTTATATTTTKTTTATWLLRVLCLVALFSCGHAGFACLSNPCVFGVCIDGLNSSYSCYCIDGYTGIQCQTNWDECWSGPCQNGGTCVDGVAYYNCTCPDGFTGSNCEENVDECMSNPCQNGGHCRDRNNGYTCTCQPGYLGINCELDVAVCDTGTGARCQNGGECMEGPGLEFSCECTSGWHGRICQEEINECESAPCQNGGVCVDKLAAYVCACPMGYTGTNCEEEILICADNPCQNNALCLMEESVPTCYCVPDYHGEKCEYQYDECQLGPRCMNGGVCIDGVDTFSCSCAPLLTGMLCECYMIGEDSLDCNYTAHSTLVPPPSPQSPPSPSPPFVVWPVTPPIPTTPLIEVTTRLQDTSASVSVESGETDDQNGGAATNQGAGTRMTTQKNVAAVSSVGSASSEDEEYTVEPTHSLLPDAHASSETSYASESGSHSVELGRSDEFTTIAHADISSSLETTTARSASGGGGGFGANYTPSSQSSEVSKSTSDDEDSDEQPPVSFTSSSTITSHHVTTIETSFSFDYTSPRPAWHVPTYQPTAPLPPSTIRTVDTNDDGGSSGVDGGDSDSEGVGGTGGPTPPIDESDYTEHPAAATERIWTEVPTTAAPFFTEYPEVYVTTRYNEFTSKDLSVGGAGRITTHQPSTPPYYVTTESASDYDKMGGATTPAAIIPTGMPHQHHSTYSTVYEPTDALMPTTPQRPHHHHYYPTTQMPIGAVDITTTQPLYPEDLVTSTHQLPPGSPGVISTESPAVVTTDRRPVITYMPPTQLPTEPPPTETPTQPPPSHTLPPLPSFPAYTTQPATATVTKPPRVSPDSSEEVESSNTVAPGIGAGSPGADRTDNATNVDCLKQGCYNGGTCVTTSEGSRCVCRFDRQGALCEAPITIRNAAFSGDSYVSHRIHKDIPNHESLDSVLPMHVQLKVRTRATNGLIMLAAAQGTKGGHYMALFLQKGLLQFQFSCGLQTMLLSELETPVNTGNEITIRAELDFSRNYTHCNASLLVNDTLAMSGDQPTWLKLLPARLHSPDAILNTWLHLGGAPQAPIGLIIELPPAQSGTGFTGCLHSLRINEAQREIFGEALDGFGITECGSLACLSSPCRNGAACIKIETNDIDENSEKVEKWKCKCPTGYMGPTCEISVCEDNPCQYGGTCVQFPGSGYLCLCPLGKHGHYCEHNLEVALPSFSGSVNGLSSFVAYTVPIPLEYSIELSFKILPQTMSQISLLAFLGQTGYHDEKSDHLAISFIQGYIMLTWNLGGGPRRIFTQKPIDFRLDAPRVPYEIKVGRIGRQAWLSVDGKFNITGRSPGSVSRMDVIPILYLGGHEIANFNTLPHDLPLHSGFQGCIYDVQLKAGQVTVPLQETRGVRGRGVGQCGTRECHRHACQHDGACLQHGATFTCICQEGWYGPLCAQPTNPCDSFNNKCSDESTCVPLVNGYECDCPVGKTGKNCEEDIRSLSDVSLTGRRSYLAVRWPYLYDNSDKIGSKRSQMVSYRNFTKKLMPPKPISSPSQHFVMKLLNEVEKQRSFSPVPLMGSKSFEEQHRVQFFLIEFQLRPLSERGLLLYFGTLNSNQDRKIGFVSLSLQGGVVEFRISGPSNHVTVVRSVRMLAIGEWHKIKMAQRGRWLTLWVEGSASSALAPSAEVLVEPDSLLYIGGLKDLSKLPHNAISGFPIPFRGCVRGLVVSGTRIVLNETNIVDSRNIRDCDGTACGGDSCEAGGHCWLDEKLQPHCICPEYAKGDRCEYSETCKLIPCRNNGRCLRSGRCSCPNGWGGFYCEIAMSKPTTPSFRGNSYLILPPQRIPIKDKRRGPSMYLRPREAIQISMNFSTIEPNGLLLWSEHDQAKFLGLGLENGHLKIASNLLGTNNDTVETPSSGYIADGGYHLARVILDRERLELQLDGEVIFTEKLADTTTLSATAAVTALTSTTRERARTSLAVRRGKEPSITYEDVFYLGGFPNMDSVTKRTKGRFDDAFKGCLQDIQFGAEPKTIITDFSAYQGENIGSCDLHGDEPIIV